MCFSVLSTILLAIVCQEPIEGAFVPPQSCCSFSPPALTPATPRIARPRKGEIIMRVSELANAIFRRRKNTPQHISG